MMTVIRVFLALFIVWFGFRVSLEDYRLGKIKNRHITLGFKILAFAVILFFLNSASGYFFAFLPEKTDSLILTRLISLADFIINPSFEFKFYTYFMMHISLVLLSAIVFWKAKIWPAGDAKLYIVFAIMVPLIFPDIVHFPKRLFLVNLINIFIPAALFFVGYMIFKITVKLFSGKYDKNFANLPQKVISALKGKINKSPTEITGWGFLLVNYFVLFSFSQIFKAHTHNYFAKILSEPMLVFGVLFLTWDKIYGYMMRKRTTALFLIIMGVYLISGSFMFPERVKNDLLQGISLTLRFGMFIMFLKTFIVYYFEKTQKYQVKTAEISPGMILTKNTLSHIKSDGSFYKECFGDYYSDGLTAHQADKIKKWNKLSNIEAAKAKPFAFWIWLGCLFTLAFKTDVFNFIKIKFPHFASVVSKLMGYS